MTGSKKPDIVFRRINGRIVPMRRLNNDINAAVRTIRVVNATASSAKIGGGLGKPPKNVKPARGLSTLATAASLASGAVGAATFFGSTNKLLLGVTAGLGIDAISTAANLAAHRKAGGTTRDKAKSFARQESVNLLASYATMGAGLLAQRRTREFISANAGKAVGALRRLILRR